MHIRLATTDDASAISALVLPLIKKFVIPDFDDDGRRNLLATGTPEAITGRMRSGYRHHVAEEDDRIVGVAAVYDDRHLFSLFVAETHQRRGVARDLWNTARHAAEPGNAGRGFTVNSSRFAVPVYLAFGFVESGPPETRGGVIAVPMKLAQVRAT